MHWLLIFSLFLYGCLAKAPFCPPVTGFAFSDPSGTDGAGTPFPIVPSPRTDPIKSISSVFTTSNTDLQYSFKFVEPSPTSNFIGYTVTCPKGATLTILVTGGYSQTVICNNAVTLPTSPSGAPFTIPVTSNNEHVIFTVHLTKRLVSKGVPQPVNFKISFCAQGQAGAGADAQGKADPVFYGFLGQRFVFTGIAGAVYNIFSDRYVQVNSKFSVANPHSNNGTIMKQITIRTLSNNVTFSVGSSVHSGVLVTINGEAPFVWLANTIISLSECITLFDSRDHRNNSEIVLSTLLHNFTVVLKEKHNLHINTTYLDIHTALDEALYGEMAAGLIGQTIKNVTLSTNDQDFISPSLFAPSKTCIFSGQVLPCKVIHIPRLDAVIRAN